MILRGVGTRTESTLSDCDRKAELARKQLFLLLKVTPAIGNLGENCAVQHFFTLTDHTRVSPLIK